MYSKSKPFKHNMNNIHFYFKNHSHKSVECKLSFIPQIGSLVFLPEKLMESNTNSQRMFKVISVLSNINPPKYTEEYEEIHEIQLESYINPS